MKTSNHLLRARRFSNKSDNQNVGDTADNKCGTDYRETRPHAWLLLGGQVHNVQVNVLSTVFEVSVKDSYEVINLFVASLTKGTR